MLIPSSAALSRSTTTSARGDATNPVPAAEVETKFLGLARSILGDGRAGLALETVRAAETVKDVRDLTALLTPD